LALVAFPYGDMPFLYDLCRGRTHAHKPIIGGRNKIKYKGTNYTRLQYLMYRPYDYIDYYVEVAIVIFKTMWYMFT
jgi:hypothetical protein